MRLCIVTFFVSVLGFTGCAHTTPSQDEIVAQTLDSLKNYEISTRIKVCNAELVNRTRTNGFSVYLDSITRGDPSKDLLVHNQTGNLFIYKLEIVSDDGKASICPILKYPSGKSLELIRCVNTYDELASYFERNHFFIRDCYEQH